MATIGYGTDTGLVQYAADRGIRLSGSKSPAALMTLALDFVDAQSFQGQKASATQTLQWPRTGVKVDGYDIADDVIPDIPGGGSVIRMQYATAIEIDRGNDPLAPVERAVKKEKVGPIETEYADSATAEAVTRTIINEGRKLLAAAGGFGGAFKVFNS